MGDRRNRDAGVKDQPQPADQYILQECAQLRDEIWVRVQDQRSTERYTLIACAVVYSFLALQKNEIEILTTCAWYVPPVLSFLAAARWCENVRLINRIADYTKIREKQMLGPRGGWETYLKREHNGRTRSVLLSGYYFVFWLFLIFSTITIAAYQHWSLLSAWKLSAALLAVVSAAIAALALIARPWISARVSANTRGHFDAARQPVRTKSVTHVSGMKRNLCVRNGPLRRWRAREDSNL